MLPLILAAVGGYLVYDSLAPKEYADGGTADGGEVNDELEEVIDDAKSISKNQKTKTYVFDYEFDRYSGKPNSNNKRYTWGYQEDVDYHKKNGFEKFIKIIHSFDNGKKIMTGVSIKGAGISAAELIKIISNSKVESISVPAGILGYVIVDKEAMINKLTKSNLIFDYDMAEDMNWIYIDKIKEK